jgi:hypothetical protein
VPALPLALERTAEAAPQVAARLIWNADVCGDASGFSARVMQRTSAVRFVDGGERVSVRLSIERRATGLDARVRIEGRGRAPIVRRIDSPDCDDALDALALVVAISIEGRPARAAGAKAPRHRAPRSEPPAVEPPAVEPPASAAAESAPPPESPPGPEPTPPEPTPPVAAEPVAAPPPPPPAAAPAAAPLRVAASPEAGTAPASEIDVGAGLSATAAFGVAPDPLIGARIWVSAAWDRHDLWSPEVALSFTHTQREGVAELRGDVDFELNAVSLGLCPLRVGSDVVHVRPCAVGSIGELASDGHATFEAEGATRPWADLGGALEVIGRIGIVELRAVAGLTAPLVRDGFRFGPPCSDAACEADVFHRVAPVIWSGAVGAGLSVW